MKKYLFLTIAMFATIAMQSCNNDDGDDVPPVTYDVDTVSTDCEGIYFGDSFFANDVVYTHYLRIGDKPLADQGSLDPTGTYYILRVSAPLEDFPAAGSYETTSETGKYTEYTILTGDISYIPHKGSMKYIKEGTMEVSTSGGQYTIEINLTTTDGKSCHTIYEGEFLLTDRSIE